MANISTTAKRIIDRAIRQAIAELKATPKRKKTTKRPKGDAQTLAKQFAERAIKLEKDLKRARKQLREAKRRAKYYAKKAKQQNEGIELIHTGMLRDYSKPRANPGAPPSTME